MPMLFGPEWLEQGVDAANENHTRFTGNSLEILDTYMREVSKYVKSDELRKKIWGNIYKLFVDAYFERFVIAVSARLPKVNGFSKEIYNIPDLGPSELILSKFAKVKDSYKDTRTTPFDKE